MGTILTFSSIVMGLFHSTLMPIVSQAFFFALAFVGGAVLVVILGIVVNPFVALVLLAALIDAQVTRKLRESR